MKRSHFFSRKNRWYAWRPVHSEQQGCDPSLHRLVERSLPEKSSPSEALQRWLKAGGNPGDASGYDLEIFVGSV